ncbi:MAG: radical SAM protein [Geobacteraceae bacterium]|nr:radical SAM protein [Geobacteraceae bacterium]
MNGKKRLLLVYPAMGMSGALVRHLPLSLLYAAADALKSGFSADIVDVRLDPSGWRENIAARLSADTILVGISVMTGTPVSGALEITRWIKQHYPDLPVVWGGPHVTFCGDEVLFEQGIDFAVSGYGSKVLCRLACNLRGDSDALPLELIPGLICREPETSVARSVPPDNTFELLDFRDIPYQLIESDLPRYGQLDMSERIFPLYSSMGCPYRCSFCSSPAQYSGMEKKYLPISPGEVVDHIEYVHKRYGAGYIYFIDDDSFVDLAHVAAIIDGIDRRGIRVRLGFRGARVDEILRMDDEFLSKLVASGTSILHIGAESGSQRMLDLMRKGCTVADILEVNLRLAKHPEIVAAYNWVVGTPGETLDDLRQTRELILQLLDENPAAIIFAPNMYRPLPGTELYELALKHGYRRPERLEEWAEVEVEGGFRPDWISPEFARTVEMMRVTSYFIDDKPLKLQTGNTLAYRMLRIAAWLYGPLARLRFRHGITAILVEQRLFAWFVGRMRG